MKQNEIYKIYGENYKEMTLQLLEVSGLKELLEAKKLPKEARIGIKPNLVSPTPAEYGATTHPEVVAGIIEYLYDHEYTNLFIIEGSWIGDKTADAYEYCGYREICEKYQVPFLDTQKDSSSKVDCQGMELRICDQARTMDFMINVPVMKGHGQTKITCALKNMKGLIPNTEKRHFHTMGLHKPIAHLSRGIRQDFIVVDHICGDLELEDGGNPIGTNCIMTGLDPVLMDSYVCHKLGFEPEDVEYIPLAEQMGSGSTDLSTCQVTVWDHKKDCINIDKSEENEKKQFCTTFGALDFDPFEERRSTSENLLDISYAIEDADSCSACYASLAPVILRLKEEGLYGQLMKCLDGKISIGQGFCGKTGKIGVGNCCRNFQFNIPGCPPKEEEVYEFLKGYLDTCN